jgi:vancomycin resistance protein YoaR
MKKILLGVSTILGVPAVLLCIGAARHEDTVLPNTYLGNVDVGGLTPTQAAKKVRVWWESERRKPIELQAEALPAGLEPVTPNTLGVTLDDEASVRDLPLQSYSAELQAKVSKEEPPRTDFPIQYRMNGQKPKVLRDMVKAATGEPTPATIRWVKGKIVRKPESARYELDEPRLYEEAVNAIREGRPVQLPLTTAPKRIADEDLERVKEVVAEFSTTFNRGQTSRCENIRLAASKLNNVLLAPGEKVSFNDSVGRRTIAAGFKLAGVYINGRHDTGVGGGICQVSTTLYNAALFANLKIPQRRNHSLPVPYVPVGRDATVDYGNIDLVIENSFDHPIGIVSQYQPGKLTFRILGSKTPGLSVKVTQGPQKLLPVRERRVNDSALAFGKTRILEGGSNGRSLLTYRHVYQGGKLVRTETLGRSYYGGGVRLVAVGTKKAPVAKPSEIDGLLPTEGQ